MRCSVLLCSKWRGDTYSRSENSPSSSHMKTVSYLRRSFGPRKRRDFLLLKTTDRCESDLAILHSNRLRRGHANSLALAKSDRMSFKSLPVFCLAVARNANAMLRHNGESVLLRNFFARQDCLIGLGRVLNLAGLDLSTDRCGLASTQDV